MQAYNLHEFLENPERYGSAERFLQLAIETCNDIGNHIIADNALGTVNSYRDIPYILSEQGIIDQRIREKWINMIGFRNILVHDYLEIDHMIVYRALQEGLSDIEALARVFAQYL